MLVVVVAGCGSSVLVVVVVAGHGGSVVLVLVVAAHGGGVASYPGSFSDRGNEPGDEARGGVVVVGAGI